VFVPLHALVGGVHTEYVGLRTPCVEQQTTIVAVQTGFAGQQTSLGNGLFTEIGLG
jgi:hypothetical protein